MNSSLKLQVKYPLVPESNGKKKKKRRLKKEVTDLLITNDLKNEFPLNIKWKNLEFGIPTVYKEKMIQKNYVT